ncbi:MAG: PilZ domain-containing protein [Candidatus Schekmanbacteria bacterium]|nr:PilZ domain-containing protein [Candidatus Schekmanbacteria bacterium]
MKVLLVGDLDAVAAVLQQRLSEVAVHLLSDPVGSFSVLAAYKRLHPDVIVLDLDSDLCRQAAARICDAYPDAVIVAASSFAAPRASLQAYRSGARDFVVKRLERTIPDNAAITGAFRHVRRRREVRLRPTHVTVELRVPSGAKSSHSLDAALLNVSRHGMAVDLGGDSNHIEAGTAIHFVLHFVSGTVDGAGTVRWRDGSRAGIALADSEDAAALLAHIVEHIASDGAG